MKNEDVEMSSDELNGRHTSQWLPTAGIALATPFLVWFAIGDYSGGAAGWRLGTSSYGGADIGGPFVLLSLIHI